MDPSMDTCQYIRCTAAQFSINEVPGFDVLGVPDQFPLDVSQFRLKKKRGNVIYRGLSFMWKKRKEVLYCMMHVPPNFFDGPQFRISNSSQMMLGSYTFKWNLSVFLSFFWPFLCGFFANTICWLILRTKRFWVNISSNAWNRATWKCFTKPGHALKKPPYFEMAHLRNRFFLIPKPKKQDHHRFLGICALKKKYKNDEMYWSYCRGEHAKPQCWNVLYYLFVRVLARLTLRRNLPTWLQTNQEGLLGTKNGPLWNLRKHV